MQGCDLKKINLIKLKMHGRLSATITFNMPDILQTVPDS